MERFRYKHLNFKRALSLQQKYAINSWSKSELTGELVQKVFAWKIYHQTWSSALQELCFKDGLQIRLSNNAA